jgi:hypothetical protein
LSATGKQHNGGGQIATVANHGRKTPPTRDTRARLPMAVIRSLSNRSTTVPTPLTWSQGRTVVRTFSVGVRSVAGLGGIERMLAVFEFLVEEMASIKTRKFHLVDGPASLEFREAVESSGFSVPSSYMQFVLQFGNAKLYRRVDHYNSCYLVEVFAAPRETVSNDGERLLQIGHTRPNSTQLSFVYFKDPPILNGEESPVFEWQHGQEVRKTADGFLEWFEAKCSSARKRYQKSEWEVIENGPSPRMS